MTGTWLTGQLAGLLFRHAWPPASISQSLSIALRLPGRPQRPADGLARAGPCIPARPGRLRRRRPAHHGPDGRRRGHHGRQILAGRSRRGYASARQIRTRLSEKAVLARADVIRPSLAGQPKTVTDAGVRAGRALESGIPLAISAESSVLLFAAPGSARPARSSSPGSRTGPGPRW